MKTRTVFSALCGILCLLLIGWWMRSQSTCTFATFKVSPFCTIQIGSYPGSLHFYLLTYDEYVRDGGTEEWEEIYLGEVESWPADQLVLAFPSGNYSKVWGSFILREKPNLVPFWFLTLLTGVAATASFPWQHVWWRFSLRTMLIAMTAVAVGLWFILWLAKR